MRQTTINERLAEIASNYKLSVRGFEKQIGVSNGFVKNASKGIGADKMQSILRAFPDVNEQWLLTGEGEMLKSGAVVGGNVKSSTVVGANVSGSGNNISNSDAIALSKAIDEISEMRKILQEQVKNNQEQFDRFMAVIEKLTGK